MKTKQKQASIHIFSFESNIQQNRKTTTPTMGHTSKPDGPE